MRNKDLIHKCIEHLRQLPAVTFQLSHGTNVMQLAVYTFKSPRKCSNIGFSC